MAPNFFEKAHSFIIEKAKMLEMTRIDTQINHNITKIVNHQPLSPAQNTPPSTTQMFTGQEKYLSKLHQHFDNSVTGKKMFLLHGMGGIGKTQICLKFKDEISDKFRYVFWIEATSENTIEQCLNDIYKKYIYTDNADTEASNISYSSSTVLNWIADLKLDWLMIFDNTDGTPDIVGKFIPSGNKGNILISSRNPEHKQIVSPRNALEVKEMHIDAAVDLLLKSSGVDTDSEQHHHAATRIVKKLHFLPLAIDHAGAYISSGRCSINDYISLYDEHRSMLMSRNKFSRATQHEKSVYGTWEISFKEILKMSSNLDDENMANAAKYAIALINICAFFHHEQISKEIFKRSAKYFLHHVKKYKKENIPAFLPNMDPKLLNNTSNNLWNEPQYQDSIGILMSFSLIKKTTDDSIFSFHPLVQAWCQDRLTQDDRKTWIWNSRGVLVSSVSDQPDHNHPTTLSLHAVMNLSHEDSIESMIYYDDVLNIMAEIMKISGEYELENRLRCRIWNFYSENCGEESPATLSSLDHLAVTCERLGDWATAESLENNAMKIRTKTLGIENPETLRSMTNLANLYDRIGKWSDAGHLQNLILETSTRILGDEHPETLACIASLANTYRKLGRYSEAETLGTRALALQKRILGTEHPAMLTSMGNLANVYTRLGKYTEAEILEKQVLEMKIRILGHDHPETLTSMGNLAITLSSLGKLSEAEDLLLTVVKLRTQILGKEHPATLTSMANLANTFGDLGKFIEAEMLEVEILGIRTRILGSEHPDTLTSMNNLSITYQNIGKHSEAEQLLTKVLDMMVTILGKEHPDTLSTMGNLAYIYITLGKFSEAEKLQIQVLESSVRILGEEHPVTLNAMGNLAYTYRTLGKFSEAKELQIQVLESSVRILGKEHPHTLASMSNLALTYANTGELAEAERLERKTLELRREIIGCASEHPDKYLDI